MCTIIFNLTAGNYKQSLVHKGEKILQNTKKQESHAIISTLLPIENLCFYTTRTTYKFSTFTICLIYLKSILKYLEVVGIEVKF